MNLRLLHAFVVLAEERNFTRAAARLRIAQPALSQQIRSLEQQLGMGLVDRAGRPVRLTEAGAFLLTQARSILATWEQTEREASAIAAGTRGWLAIGFTRSSMYSVLPPALRAFHEANPRVELELHEMVTEEQADALTEGRIHVGIGRQPERIAGCTSRTVLRERVVVVLPPDHPNAADAEVRIADLADTPVVLYPRHPAAQFARSIESLYRDAGIVPDVAHRTFEIQTAIGLVAAGLGVTFVGESVAALARPDVVYRPVADLHGRPSSSLEAVFRERDDSPHLHAFLACLPTGLDDSDETRRADPIARP